MTFRFGAAALAVLPPCAAWAAPLAAEPAAQDNCSLALTARFTGARAVPEVRRTIGQVARPHPVRWITPGLAITLDHNPERLNVILDEDGRIAGMRCG